MDGNNNNNKLQAIKQNEVIIINLHPLLKSLALYL